ncbi:MAG: AAA family ATPase [Propionibacteriaceae bacterium]|jgi:hypothetical protein|nr:AAA family ATPase [Propionibacteriaceae bacterium]
MTNPFSPTFGTNPYLLVGRAPVLQELARDFDLGPGSPAQAVLFTGVRGVGKTVMLNEFQDIVRARGWLVISDGSSKGLLDRLAADRLPRLLASHAGKSRSKLSSGSISTPIGGVSATWSERYPAESSLRSQIEELTDALAPRETGLLITVDEIQGADPEELRKLGEVIQLTQRDGRRVAFAAAGLPAAVDDLLNDNVVTFLRRAERIHLGMLLIDEVADGMAQMIRETGRQIGDEAVGLAAMATCGYPFLVQLIGYRSWNQNPDAERITLDDVGSGITEAIHRLSEQVFAPSLAPLSERDRDYLLAMAGKEDSQTKDIADRLGVAAQYASTYRARLMSAGLIEPAGWGKVRFTLPYFSEWILSQVG